MEIFSKEIMQQLAIKSAVLNKDLQGHYWFDKDNNDYTINNLHLYLNGYVYHYEKPGPNDEPLLFYLANYCNWLNACIKSTTTIVDSLKYYLRILDYINKEIKPQNQLKIKTMVESQIITWFNRHLRWSNIKLQKYENYKNYLHRVHNDIFKILLEKQNIKPLQISTEILYSIKEYYENIIPREEN